MIGLALAAAVSGAASEQNRPADWQRAYSGAELGHVLADEITVGGIAVQRAHPPAGLRVDSDLGLLLNVRMEARRIHGWPQPFHKIDVARGFKTPKGDYLIMFPAGQEQYGIPQARWRQQLNPVLTYRSSDQGRTWSLPEVAWDVPYLSGPVVPFIPRGQQRIYLFGTEPIPELRKHKEDGPIGFRTSDDDGHHWSAWQRIRPANDPDYIGISEMRMTETGQGTWILGTHGGGKEKTKEGPVLARQQYALRSTDQGRSWTLLPDKTSNGWYGVLAPDRQAKRIIRLQEGEVLTVADGSILQIARSAEGHLWELRSRDDGLTWTAPQPTTLVHGDAPPMVYPISDGKTLLALHHNRYNAQNPLFNQQDRTELWCSLSHDCGRTWSAPRFLFANLVANARRPNLSYTDVFVDGDWVNFVIPHLWEQIVFVRLKISDLPLLPLNLSSS